MNESPPKKYPPKDHFLRDLRIKIERDGASPEATTASLEIQETLLDSTGRPRLGVLATLVDVIAGESAIRAILPNWAATSDLSLTVDELPTKGRIRASLKILRSGGQSILLEVELRPDGAPLEVPPCGVATLTFMVLPARENDSKAEHFSKTSAPTTEFGTDQSGFDEPILSAFGMLPDPEDCAVMRLPMRPYLSNSLKALQGGAGALLLEAAAERFAADQLGEPVRLRSLAIHYLKLGRVGPIRAEARKLAATPSGLLVRVELRDEGVQDALLTVATLQIEAGVSPNA